MRRHLVGLLLLALPPALSAALPAHQPGLYVEGEMLVKYRTAAAAPQLQAKRDLGFVTKARRLGGELELLQLPSVTTVDQALDLVRDDPAVEFAEPNFRRFARATPPNDPRFPDQWGLHSTGQANFLSNDPALASIPGADMDMLAAWDPGGNGAFDRVGDGSVTVAVIDDSVSTGHEDLEDNIIDGFDFVRNDANPDPDPGTDQFHGTLVAGCVGAVGNNGSGVAGTAWHVKLMPLKFGFDVDSFVAAMDFARAGGAHIVNASFGGPSFSQAEVAAIERARDAGMLFVAAAGNDDSNTDVAQLNYPANHAVDNIVSVAATNRQDNIASFSQYGPVTVDVAAPGLQIVTTANNDGYSTNPGTSGTSFSSPYTAGIAALIQMEVVPTPSYREIKARLIEGAEPGSNVNVRTAAGRVNAANSLNLTERPALVIQNVQWIDANGALDSPENTQVDVTVTNLWQDAANVQGTLNADNGVTVNGAVAFGTITAQGTATQRFDVTVPAGVADHRYVTFTLALTADGGYSASRKFIAEIGDLGEPVVTQAFAARDADLYDEFHAWHFDLTALPAGHNQLVIQTTSTPDIDLLVKKDQPPRYDITVGINPETDVGFFCTSATTTNCLDPDTFLSAGADGNETVVVSNPPPGTYHIVVVNFAQLENGLTYTLRAFTRQGSTTPANVPSGGDGAVAPTLLLAFLAAVLARRRLRR